ncbi:hypothetical protein E4U22_008583, partial [Claviceps purpurea]
MSDDATNGPHPGTPFPIPNETVWPVDVPQLAPEMAQNLPKQAGSPFVGYAGGAILPVFDAIYNSKHLDFILPRHEQGAGHMAEGYARASGKPGVVLVTSGPGATN